MHTTYVSNKNPDCQKKIENYVNDKFKGTADTRHGTLMEEPARQCYQRMTDFTVINMGLLINPSIPWIGFSPDGIVLNKHIIEIKNPKVGKVNTASEAVNHLKYVDRISDKFVLKQRHKYYCQVQLGMFISRLEF